MNELYIVVGKYIYMTNLVIIHTKNEKINMKCWQYIRVNYSRERESVFYKRRRIELKGIKGYAREFE